MLNFGIGVLTKTISHNLQSAHFFQISLHPTVQAGWNTIIWLPFVHFQYLVQQPDIFRCICFNSNGLCYFVLGQCAKD